MTDQQTISWIFLATALASQTEPSDIKSILNIADAINHAIPTQKELRTSIAWLIEKGLVTEKNNTYSLTPKGKSDYAEASKKTTVLFKIWDKLEMKLNEYV